MPRIASAAAETAVIIAFVLREEKGFPCRRGERRDGFAPGAGVVEVPAAAVDVKRCPERLHGGAQQAEQSALAWRCAVRPYRAATAALRTVDGNRQGRTDGGRLRRLRRKTGNCGHGSSPRISICEGKKKISPGVHEFEYLLENKFFVDIDGTEVQKGKVKVHLTVKRSSMMFEMNFQIEGVVVVPCDRCLDDMEIPIDTHNRLAVKFGKEYAEESDEVVVIPEEEGAINLAWFLYEFIALAVPMKHVHAPGKCNKAMSSKLKKHTARSSDETEDDFEDDMGGDDLALEDDGNASPADPRWDALKGLLENDNN